VLGGKSRAGIIFANEDLAQIFRRPLAVRPAGRQQATQACVIVADKVKVVRSR
jgi:hypothetical protein